MGIIVDLIFNKNHKINDKPELIIDEKFMMGMFDTLEKDIPEFKDYKEYLYKERKSSFATRTGAKFVSYQLVRKELFHPSDIDNKETTKLMPILGKITADCMIEEFLHEQKVTCWYLSKIDGRLSFRVSKDEEKTALVGKRATNNSAESSFSSFTQQLVTYNMIDLHIAGITFDAKKICYFFLLLTRKEIKDKVKDGMMLTIPFNVRIAIIQTAIEEAPWIRLENIKDLEKQSQTRKDKEQEEYKKKMNNYASRQAQAKYYFRLYKGESCVKSVADLDHNLETLSLRQQQIHIIDNIKICVEGFGQQQYKHA